MLRCHLIRMWVAPIGGEINSRALPLAALRCSDWPPFSAARLIGRLLSHRIALRQVKRIAAAPSGERKKGNEKQVRSSPHRENTKGSKGTRMGDISDEEKVKIASQFLLASPPGEFNDVFNDIRVLVNNDSLLQRQIAPVFQTYNVEQFATTTTPGTSNEVIISKHGEVGANKYVDPRSKVAFTYDHMRQTASNPEPYTPDAKTEPHRAALDSAIAEYVADHFPHGVATVYGKDGTITIAIVDNSYNPNNFWNGRWRSLWTVKVGQAEIKGLLRSQVHYYEDGNVQLNSSKEVTVGPATTSDPASFAASIVKLINKAESEYQTAVNDSYNQLSDTTFKALRRALPITRSKLDWNKILNYKIGSELSQK